MRRVTLTSGLVTTLAGNVALVASAPFNYGNADGFGASATFFFPQNVAMDAGGTFAVVVS